jgi:hypothetical protein
VRRLNSADAPRMRSIVAMLPPPEWRGENIPRRAHFARALADPAVYVFAAFEGERPAGFVSASGATGAGQDYVQFEFDLAAAGGEEKA